MQLPRGYTGATGAIGATGTKGNTGAQGSTGATGAQGEPGLSSSVFIYTFNTQTTGTPTNGNLFLNNTDVSLATILNVSHIDKTPGHDIDQLLNTINIGSKIIIQHSTDSNIYINYYITGKTINSGYVSYNVNYDSKLGTIANGREVIIIIQMAGIAGPAGATGATGIRGPSSSVFDYKLDTLNYVVSEIGSGYIRFDNATITSATTMWVHYLNEYGTDWQRIISMFPTYSRVMIQDKATANYVLFYISDLVIRTANQYIMFPIQYIQGINTTLLTNNMSVYLVNYSGTIGLDGPQGATGATGAAGAAGTNGATGAQGSTGPAGTNGTNGATGAQGSTGPAGTNGTNGATGAQGSTGPAGATGTNGATGAQGSTGPAGATGATGATGAVGAAGGTIGFPWMPIAMTTATQPTAATRAYWYVIYINTNTLLSSVNWYQTAGSDTMRISVYRGKTVNSTTVLCGQTSSIIPSGAGYYSSALTVQAGQNLTFNNEYITVGFHCSGGTNMYLQGQTSIADTNISYTTSSNYSSAGFPANLSFISVLATNIIRIGFTFG